MDRRPNEKGLATIFSKLVRYQDRTSISFYLPGMEVGTGAFATTLLDRNASDPTLEVRIRLEIAPLLRVGGLFLA